MAPELLKMRVPLTEAVMTTAPAPARLRCAVVQGEVGSAQVDVDGPVPLVGLKLVDRRPDAVDAGVGDDDVEAAETLDQFAHRALERLGIGDIGPQRQGVAAGLADLHGSPVHLLAGAAQDADAGAGCRQPHRRRPADA